MPTLRPLLLKTLGVMFASFTMPAVSTVALAADAYPVRPVRLILPAAVGGSMATELFKITADIDVVIVEYKSGGPAVIDLLGGHTQAMLATIASVLPHIKAGKLKALGTSGAERSALLPDTPTIAEAGVPGFETVQWHGLVAPAGTPAPIIDKLHRELKAILASDETKKRLLNAGVETDYLGPTEFWAFSKREMDQWARVIKKANITLKDQK